MFRKEVWEDVSQNVNSTSLSEFANGFHLQLSVLCTVWSDFLKLLIIIFIFSMYNVADGKIFLFSKWNLKRYYKRNSEEFPANYLSVPKNVCTTHVSFINNTLPCFWGFPLCPCWNSIEAFPTPLSPSPSPSFELKQQTPVPSMPTLSEGRFALEHSCHWSFFWH